MTEYLLPAVYFVKNVYSDKFLHVARGGKDDCANATQSADTSLASQWMISRVGKDLYGMQNANSAKRLNVEGGQTSNGAQVWQFHIVCCRTTPGRSLSRHLARPKAHLAIGWARTPVACRAPALSTR
jgi:hypothetical protein